MKKLLSLVTLSLVTIMNNSYAEVFTVEKLNDLNQLHDVAISPLGDNVIYGVKKGTSSTDNHLYVQNLTNGKVKQ